jgi:hypothetical protein
MPSTGAAGCGARRAGVIPPPSHARTGRRPPFVAAGRSAPGAPDPLHAVDPTAVRSLHPTLRLRAPHSWPVCAAPVPYSGPPGAHDAARMGGGRPCTGSERAQCATRLPRPPLVQVACGLRRLGMLARGRQVPTSCLPGGCIFAQRPTGGAEIGTAHVRVERGVPVVR